MRIKFRGRVQTSLPVHVTFLPGISAFLVSNTFRTRMLSRAGQEPTKLFGTTVLIGNYSIFKHLVVDRIQYKRTNVKEQVRHQ